MLRFVLRTKSRPAGGHGLLVDRDGVLNRRIVDGYVLAPEELDLLDGVVPVLRRAAQMRVPIAIVSNQGALSRGLLTEATLEAIHRKLLDHLAVEGVAVDAMYVCPHHPAAPDPADRECGCRKPRPGLLLAAAEDLGLDLARSVFIGDQESDRQAAAAAGIPGDRFWLVEAETMTTGYRDQLVSDVAQAFRPTG